jgi:hypothetical protein
MKNMKTKIFRTRHSDRSEAKWRNLPTNSRFLGKLGMTLLLALALAGCNNGYAPWVDPDAIDTPTLPGTADLYTGHPEGVPRLRGVNINSYHMTQPALDTLAAWNVNHVRWWMNFEKIDLTNMTVYMSQVERECEILLKWLPQLEQRGIYVSFCMGLMPGGRSGEDRTTGYVMVCTKQEYQNTFVEAWRLIAGKLKGQKAMWGYELSNEPGVYEAAGNLADGLLPFMPLCRKASKAIRAEDPETAIIVTCAEDGEYEREFESFDPDDVPNVVYTDHMYHPLAYTHQSLLAEAPTPMKYPNAEYNKATLREFFERRMKSIAQPHHLHVYIGEFGVVRWAEGADAYYRDVIELMEEYEYDWALFNYNLAGEGQQHLTLFSVIHGTNPNHQYVSPIERTPQFYEALKYFQLNQH